MMETEDALAQEQYWQLSTQCGRALAALWEAERAVELSPDRLNRNKLRVAREASTAADAAYQAFASEHDGETFKVFRPEDIERALSPDIKPLWDVDTLTDTRRWGW